MPEKTYPARGYAGVDRMLCPRCGARGRHRDADEGEEFDPDWAYIQCDSCDNTGRFNRFSTLVDPATWEFGVERIGEIAGQDFGEMRVTVGRDLECEESRKGVQISMSGPYDIVCKHLSPELRKYCESILESMSFMEI